MNRVYYEAKCISAKDLPKDTFNYLAVQAFQPSGDEVAWGVPSILMLESNIWKNTTDEPIRLSKEDPNTEITLRRDRPSDAILIRAAIEWLDRTAQLITVPGK